jgi:hypothetical protein
MLVVVIIIGIATLQIAHAFVAPIDLKIASPLSKKCATILPPLYATESFQRSLLEAQFLNSVPDLAPKILDGEVTKNTNNMEAQNTPNNNVAIQNLILRIAASTDRGQNANLEQKERISQLITSLVHEQKHITTTTVGEGTDIIIPSYLSGTWELLYSNTQLFRSSPFFMAGRATCTTPEQAAQYDWFCDMHRAALAISTIGSVRQIINSSSGRLVNEFEVKVGAVPFLSDILGPTIRYSGGLPFTIDGAIVSTADITKTMYNNQNNSMMLEWELFMDTVEIKGSNIPLLRTLLDTNNVVLKSRDLSKVLEDTIDTYKVPKPIIRTIYVNDDIRIVKDVDDNVFIYAKVSDSEEMTDYSYVLPDLGVASLLERFNDAVTKIYL